MIIRLQMDIETDLTPGELFERVQKAIEREMCSWELSIISGHAEKVDDDCEIEWPLRIGGGR